MRGGWHPAVQRRNGHAEVLGHVLGRHPAGQQLLGRLDLAVGHLRLAAAFAAELLGDFQPGAGALDGQLALHFGKARHDVEEEPPGWCAGVDGVGEAPELDTVLVQIADQIDQLLDRPAQPVELPDDQSIAFAQHFERLGQARPVCPRATHLVLEDLFTSGLAGVRLENGKYPTLSLFFKQAYAVALMPIQSGPCDRRLIHFMK